MNGKKTQRGINGFRSPVKIKVPHGVLGVSCEREFAEFCDYCKYGIGKEKGKALVRPAAHKQQGKPCLQDRWEQSERNI
jgi:hypothetical protein